MRGATTYAPAAPPLPPPPTADGAVDALYDIVVSQGVDCIDASRLTLDFTAFGGVKALVRGHGGDKLRWVDVGPHGRVVVVGVVGYKHSSLGTVQAAPSINRALESYV